MSYLEKCQGQKCADPGVNRGGGCALGTSQPHDSDLSLHLLAVGSQPGGWKKSSCKLPEPAPPGQMSGQVSRGSAGEYQADEQ